MATQVSMQKKEPGMVESMIPAVTGLIGGAVGTYYGGPAGGAVGSQVGGQLGQAAVSGGEGAKGVQTGADSSNPRDRYMQQMQKDPTNQLQQGKAALGSLDEQDRVMLQPVLDEALKRAWENKRNQGQPVGGNSEIA